MLSICYLFYKDFDLSILVLNIGSWLFISVFILRFAVMPLILQDQSRAWSCLQVTQTSRKNAFLFLDCSLKKLKEELLKIVLRKRLFQL